MDILVINNNGGYIMYGYDTDLDHINRPAYYNMDSIECAQIGDWVYFTKEYDAGNIIVPINMGAKIIEPAPDEIPVQKDYYLLEIDINGEYYEVEAPISTLDMQ